MDGMERKWGIGTIVAALGTVAFVVLLILFFTSLFQKPASTSSTSTNSFPNAASNTTGTPISGSGTVTSSGIAATSTMQISGAVGTLTVADFIHNGVTAADPENPGKYYLAGSPGYCLPNGSCPGGASTTQYNIVYESEDQLFSIVLLSEPLGEVRLEAQQFLEKTLGLSDSQLCTLNYYVGTISGVNEIYAGTNLGFSFCPGATDLPTQ